jgi:hypothetical protein
MSDDLNTGYPSSSYKGWHLFHVAIPHTNLLNWLYFLWGFDVWMGWIPVGKVALLIRLIFWLF